MADEMTDTPAIECLQDAILDSGDVEEFLNRLAALAVESVSLPNDDVLCGITLLRRKKAVTAASSNDRARTMDEVQYRHQGGPCLESAESQAVVHIPAVQDEIRWPEYLREISEMGARSLLAVPFHLEAEAKASLNLYSSRAGFFGPEKIKATEIFARHTTKSMRLAVRVAQHTDTITNLKAAMESRTVIDRAIGILMGESRCGQDEAFRILQSASSNRNLKLREVAARIVSSVAKEPAETHFEP